MTYALWIVQGVLAALFLFAGGMKLVLPLEELKGPVELPGPFLRFIGVAEVFGAIRPASTFVEVKGLIERGWLVEIEADCVADQ